MFQACSKRFTSSRFAKPAAGGFGYVTLDSPQAADLCLAQPQVIDGRARRLWEAWDVSGLLAVASSGDVASGPRDEMRTMEVKTRPLMIWTRD